jgi:ribosome-binding factor A
MAREFKRTDRVAEQLQRELAQIIQLEIRDPRVGMVTVCAVDLSRDLHYATVYVTFLGIEETVGATQAAIDVLNDASSYIRTLIGKRMRMRAVPHVKFLFDQSISRGRDLSSLIKQARDKDSQLSDSNVDVNQENDTGLDSEPKAE